MTDFTPLYNLKAVMHETGIGAEALRAWERRYGLFKPQRSAGGHRLYSQYDIDILKWLVARQKEGLSISRAVEMWRSLEKNGQDPLQQTHTPQQVVEVGGTILDELRQDWIAACMAFDEPLAEQALSQAFAIAAPEIACTDVVQKGLSEVGQGWYQGRINVQQEHFASALAMRRIDTLYAAAPPATRPERILAACPPGEEHDFGLLLMAYLLRRRGWDVVYLGANVPLSQLTATLQVTSPRLVLSVAQTLNSAVSLREMADEVSRQGAPLAYGGGIFNLYPAIAERIHGYFLGDTIAAAPQVVERLLSLFPPLPVIEPLSHEYTQALAKFVENEALIIASVSQAMQSEPVEPARLETTSSNLTRSIASALSLGDIHYLDGSIGWLKGLLEPYGQSPSVGKRYFAAYRRAVENYLGGQAVVILDGLATASLGEILWVLPG